MSVFYITGKPGGGKTYVAVAQICQELKNGKGRNIVTNIALNLPELAEWCHKNVKEPVNLDERLRILDEEETAEFWLYEPHFKYEGRREIKKGKMTMEVPDFRERGMPGTLYVIDEVHIYFGAREWQSTGPDCTYFLTQHRKMACDVVLVTQHPDQTDKALRRLAQEYMTVRNLSREPVFGFRIANFFRLVRSLNSPTSPNPGTFDTAFLKLHAGEYGKLYDTMAGVGIAGRLTPDNEQRGIHWYWLGVPLAAILVFFGWLFTHLPTVSMAIHNCFNHTFFHVAKSAMEHSVIHVNNPKAVTASPTQTDAKVAVPAVNSALPTVTVVSETNEIYCTGFVVLDGRSMVFLSDGRTAYSEYGEVDMVRPHRVKVFGQYFDVHSTAQIACEPGTTLMYQPLQNFNAGTENVNPVATSSQLPAGIITMRNSGIPSNKPYAPHARTIAFGQEPKPSQQSSPFSGSAFPLQGNP